MKPKYQPQQFEQSMTEAWHIEGIHRSGNPTPPEASLGANPKGSKMYTLVMFPYPSGAGLHVGHVRVYTGTDVLARYYRMNGYSVLDPMGWDAFGLPAENAAIKEKKNPIDIVPRNIATFKGQMIKVGMSFDWDREFATTDPSYYKWTQYLFIQFYKMGLLYKKMTSVYFCEFCKTGLAEEEVLPNGTHERCGNVIVRKDLPQWNFRITAYADRLIEDLQGLEWPEGILSMQRNWIGKQKGLNIDFSVIASEARQSQDEIASSPEAPRNDVLTVWTKFWETIFGVTFIVVAPEHPWVQSLIADKGSAAPLRQGSAGSSTDDSALTNVKSYVGLAMTKTDEQRMKEEKDKTGVFTGHYAVNPVNGEKVPVWIADYVLSNVGTGAVMGVPSHDERDFAFAKKYNLPLKQVVTYDDKTIDTKVAAGETSFEGEGKLMNSGEFDGQVAVEGKKKMAEWMINKKIAEWKVSYHLRDWIFSRQRYWGEPIPMVYCASCAADKKTWWDTEEGKIFLENAPLRQGSEGSSANETPLTNEVVHNISENVKTVQTNQYGWFPIDQKSLPLELPYTESYEPSGTGESPLAAMTDWTKAICPVCGKEAKRETDTMPNWAGSCWYFLRFADPHNAEAPWSQESMKQWSPVDWYVGGAEHAVLHLLYSRFWVKALYDLKMIDFKEPFLRLRNVGMVLATDHRKMSKSFGNVINPDDVVNEFGADTLRVYEMFMAPFNQEISWSTEALQGSNRFLIRIWNLYHEQFGTESKLEHKHHDDKKVVAKLNKTIEKVSRDITSVKYNTAIAAMMEFLNEYEKTPHLSKENAQKFLQILAPFAPFMTEYIWRNLMGEQTSIHISTWPTFDESAVHLTEMSIPVQVNGKLRAVITIPVRDIEKDKVVRHAEEHEVIQRYIAGKIYEPVYVRGKVLNFVLKD